MAKEISNEEVREMINRSLMEIERMAKEARFDTIATEMDFHKASREIIREAQYLRYLANKMSLKFLHGSPIQPVVMP